MDLRHFAVEKLQLALEKINWPEPLATQQEITDKVEMQVLMFGKEAEG